MCVVIKLSSAIAERSARAHRNIARDTRQGRSDEDEKTPTRPIKARHPTGFAIARTGVGDRTAVVPSIAWRSGLFIAATRPLPSRLRVLATKVGAFSNHYRTSYSAKPLTRRLFLGFVPSFSISSDDP